MSGTLREQRKVILDFLNSDGLAVKYWRKRFIETFGFETTKDMRFVLDPCETCGVQQALAERVIVASRTEAERNDFIQAARDIADREGFLVTLEAVGMRETAVFGAPTVLYRLTGRTP